MSIEHQWILRQRREEEEKKLYKYDVSQSVKENILPLIIAHPKKPHHYSVYCSFGHGREPSVAMHIW